MGRLTYMSAPVRVTWARRAGRITLKRSAAGRWTLTLPEGVTAACGAQYLDSFRPQKRAAFVPAYARGERHLVLGERVTLGERGVPCGAAFTPWRQAKLRALLDEMTAAWLARFDAADVTVTVAPLPGRWGRCLFARRQIELNADCALLPPQAVEELLAHELCHLAHHDHSPVFWAALTSVMPDWPRREGLLRSLDLTPWPEEST